MQVSLLRLQDFPFVLFLTVAIDHFFGGSWLFLVDFFICGSSLKIFSVNPSLVLNVINTSSCLVNVLTFIAQKSLILRFSNPFNFFFYLMFFRFCLRSPFLVLGHTPIGFCYCLFILSLYLSHRLQMVFSSSGVYLEMLD